MSPEPHALHRGHEVTVLGLAPKERSSWAVTDPLRASLLQSWTVTCRDHDRSTEIKGW